MRRNLFVALACRSRSFWVASAWLRLPRPRQPPRPSPANGTTKHTALENLRQAHRLLVKADHDYDGHRARAAEEVHKAIRELEGKHHAKKVQTGRGPRCRHQAPKVKQPAIHEAQASSDAQLRQALTILQGVQAELNSRHPKAAANVTAAIAKSTRR